MAKFLADLLTDQGIPAISDTHDMQVAAAFPEADAGERVAGDDVAGPRRGPTPRDVTLHALHQQRMHLLLTSRVRLAREVIPLLPARIARDLRTTIRARRGLGRLTPPVPRSRFRTGPALPAGVLLEHYREAQRRFGVGWPVLAAVNFVESAFGRLRNDSVAGAQGPMQFLPSTWKRYGRGGDIQATGDAIGAAARLLAASGAPADMAAALYAYNPSRRYVRAVSAYASQLHTDRRAFLGYYHWQVFYGDTLLPEGYPARPPTPAPAGSGGVVR